MHYIIFLLALLYCQTNAQKCLCATNGDRDLPNFVRPGGGGEPQFRVNPIQAIVTSYQFDCCGVVTQWRALVERSGGAFFQDQPYTISFQVWRPNSPSPVDTDGCYTMQGTNHFPSIPLSDPDTADRGIVTGVPLESDRIEVQPGDVVGFYLESSRNDDDGIQFARDRDNPNPYTNETVWFATGSLTPRPEATCMCPVGTSGVLSSSTNLAPLITATVLNTGCPITTARTTEATVPSTATTIAPPTLHTSPTPSQTLDTTQDRNPGLTEVTVTSTTTTIAPPTIHTSPTPSQPPGMTTDGNSDPTTAADNVGLYVGIAVPVGLVMIAVTVIMILLLFVIHKRRAKQHKQSEVVPYQATNSGNYEDINTASIVSSSTEVPSTQEHLYTTIEESTDSNSNLTQSKAYEDVITTDDDYYVNEGMGGKNEVTMKTNEAYGTTKQPQMAQLTCNYIANPLAVSHDPPTILNQAYGTTKNSGKAEVAMDKIRNEAYVGVRQLSSDNDPSIPTTENEAYTSVAANTEPEEAYDYVRP